MIFNYLWILLLGSKRKAEDPSTRSKRLRPDEAAGDEVDIPTDTPFFDLEAAMDVDISPDNFLEGEELTSILEALERLKLSSEDAELTSILEDLERLELSSEEADVVPKQVSIYDVLFMAISKLERVRYSEEPTALLKFSLLNNMINALKLIA